MDKTALFQATARLRRSFPRHEDVLAVCDEVERLANGSEVRAPKRDRAAYMRQWRSEKKSAAAPQQG